MLKEQLNQGLTVTAEEISGHSERRMDECAEELSGVRENNRRYKLVAAILNPKVQLYSADVLQVETEACEEDCSGSEPAQTLEPLTHLQQGTADEASDPPETSETQVSDNDWQKPLSGSEYESESSDDSSTEDQGPESGLQTLKSNGVHVGDTKRNTGKKSRCSECGGKLSSKRNLKIHMRCLHTGEGPFGCEVCGRRFIMSCHLKRHMKVHTREK
ncbi:zinc finger protein with KRAB and SCAN domains 5-like [Seriola aureovittata]|uniref:zinc finger protein with KRAB and SCAN domains 5-like n=1 Tax=Seriola aureovittata TaxID=2871759 RepID=UPI0024BE06C0|nr:zinc finger protein with KRAB and SCAN domains 5-like [Seriola aureovittata]